MAAGALGEATMNARQEVADMMTVAVIVAGMTTAAGIIEVGVTPKVGATTAGGARRLGVDVEGEGLGFAPRIFV